MTVPTFHPAALEEYVEALLHLEAERDGYGEKFEREVDRMIDLIRDYPKSGSLLSGYPGLELRSYPIRTFLYSLVVGFDGDRPVIYAVAHQSREPGYWSARILP